MKPAWAHEVSRAEYRLGWIKLNRMAGNPANRRVKDDNYAKYLTTPHWRIFRGEILIVARFMCADCKGPANQVHHLNYACLGRETWNDVIPICDDCHGKRHVDDQITARKRELSAAAKNNQEK